MGAPEIPIETINDRLPSQSILTAIKYDGLHRSPSGITRRILICKCKCGNECRTVVGDLLRGNPLSCGCVSKGRKSKLKIGDAILYKRWYDMRKRCYDPKCNNYPLYGERGVRVCDAWLNNYDAFAKWSLKNGYMKHLQLDKDIKGNGLLYSPKTCKWVEALEHSSYKTNSVKHEYKRKLMTIPEISRLTGILQSVLKSRMKTGMTAEEAVNHVPAPIFPIYKN